MRVYHFLEEKWAIEDLRNRRLKVSRLYELNDPFEFMCYDLPTAAHRAAFRYMKEQFGRRLGLLCFSRNWKNPVLWSHYAEKHTGICLGFDADDVVPVTYTAGRPHFAGKLSDLTDDFTGRWLSTKFKGWEYEDEVRTLVPLHEANEQSGLHYRSFGPHLQLKQVIVGPLCAVTAGLQRAIGRHAAEIDILKARLAFRSFGVTRDKHRFWNREHIRIPRLI